MKIKPIHILSSVWWINFFALCWFYLFDVLSGPKSMYMLLAFFLLASLTSVMSVEPKGDRRGK